MESEDYDLTSWGHGVDGNSGIHLAIMLQKQQPVFQTQVIDRQWSKVSTLSAGQGKSSCNLHMCALHMKTIAP